MAGTILVATKNLAYVSAMMPYIAQIAQPECRVVFLAPYRRENRGWFQAHLSLAHAGDFGSLAAQAVAEWCSREQQRNEAEHLLSPIRKALERKGVTVSLHLSESSIKTTVKRYEANGDLNLILVPGGIHARIAQFFYGVRNQWFGKTHLAPVRVLAFDKI